MVCYFLISQNGMVMYILIFESPNLTILNTFLSKKYFFILFPKITYRLLKLHCLLVQYMGHLERSPGVVVAD